MKYKLIIWDWNGTLLNDVDACVKAMNIMLDKRKLPLISHEYYKSIFTFPVQNYYNKLGFKFEDESFEKLSIEYIDLYKEVSEESPLHGSVIEVLNDFKNSEIDQVILSASEQNSLEYQVQQHNIKHYFKSLIGLDNIYAKSKVDNAINYIRNSKNKPEDICLIGDTYHDYEVARSIGCDCILINNGHQLLNCKSEDSKLKVQNRLSELNLD